MRDVDVDGGVIGHGGSPSVRARRQDDGIPWRTGTSEQGEQAAHDDLVHADEQARDHHRHREASRIGQ
jgi:hypothetical protein